MAPPKGFLEECNLQCQQQYLFAFTRHKMDFLMGQSLLPYCEEFLSIDFI